METLNFWKFLSTFSDQVFQKINVSKLAETLKRHIQSLHEVKKPFTSHLVSNNEGKGAFQCNICDAIFASHMASVHEGK